MSSIVVAQIGARQHYEPAAMAFRSGDLAALLTDFWNPAKETAATCGRMIGSRWLERIAGRHAEIDRSKVRSFPSIAMGTLWRRRTCNDRTSLYRDFLVEGTAFGKLCATACQKIEHEAFFGYSTGCLEALRESRRRGIYAVVDQIDPARIEDEIVREEERRHGELCIPGETPIPEEYFRRLDEEWAEANAIVVNSTWSKNALVRQKVDADKISVIPLPYARPKSRPRPPKGQRKLRVLWLGSVCLRKGLWYAVEAARALENADVTFTFAGPLAINQRNLRLPRNSVLLGQVPRGRATELYREHDVFLLPTLSDGFALTQLEAMANGLPVIATDCCGSVVQDHRSGILVPPRDTRAIVGALEEMLNPERLQTMSQSATLRSEDFKPERVWPSYRRALTPPNSRRD